MSEKLKITGIISNLVIEPVGVVVDATVDNQQTQYAYKPYTRFDSQSDTVELCVPPPRDVINPLVYRLDYDSAFDLVRSIINHLATSRYIKDMQRDIIKQHTQSANIPDRPATPGGNGDKDRGLWPIS